MSKTPPVCAKGCLDSCFMKSYKELDYVRKNIGCNQTCRQRHMGHTGPSWCDHGLISAERTSCILHEFSQWKNERDGVCVSPKEASCSHTNTHINRRRMRDWRTASSIKVPRRTRGRRAEKRSRSCDLGARQRLAGIHETLAAQPPTWHAAPASNTHTNTHTPKIANMAATKGLLSLRTALFTNNCSLLFRKCLRYVKGSCRKVSFFCFVFICRSLFIPIHLSLSLSHNVPLSLNIHSGGICLSTNDSGPSWDFCLMKKKFYHQHSQD